MRLSISVSRSIRIARASSGPRALTRTRQTFCPTSPRTASCGVDWVTPDAQDGDHMGRVTNTGGPSWGGVQPYWDDTAIIVTWDDWGGCYDDEPPFVEPYPQGGYQLGFRVPLLVISVYTAAGFIGNSRESFGGVVRFV
jgi:phospholipase C